jgi:hypothetical protein
MTYESWSRWQWIVVLLLVLCVVGYVLCTSLCGHTNAGGLRDRHLTNAALTIIFR